MLKIINREYLVSLGFLAVNERGNEYLRKDYFAVSIFNPRDEFIDSVDVSVYLQKKDNRWVISKCLSLDQYHEDVFNLHFKTNEIKDLLIFDLKNQEKRGRPKRRSPEFIDLPSLKIVHSL